MSAQHSYIFVPPLTAGKTPDIGLPAAHYEAVVLGDLTKKEAHNYFCHEINTLSKEEQDLFSTDCQSFEHVYHLTGGRMLFIDKYIIQVRASGPIKEGKLFCIIVLKE